METSFFQETDSSWEHWNNNVDLTLLELVKTKRLTNKMLQMFGKSHSFFFFTLTKSEFRHSSGKSFSQFFPFLQQMFHQVYNNSGSSIIILAIISISYDKTVLTKVPAEIWDPAQIQTVWSWVAKTLEIKRLETSSKTRTSKAHFWVWNSDSPNPHCPVTSKMFCPKQLHIEWKFKIQSVID